MANTYTQLYIHFVMAVKFMQALIEKTWKEELHKYITGIVQNHNHKLISINTMPDHLHMLIGINPAQSLSDLMRIVKSDSSEWINKRKLTTIPFRWQEGYGAFSFSKSHLPAVCSYIENQETHHAVRSFREEYLKMLKDFEIEFDEKYIFKDLI